MERRVYRKSDLERVVWLTLLALAGVLPTVALLTWLALPATPAALAAPRVVAPQAVSSPSGTANVIITGTSFSDFAFSPSVITVTTGSAVTWINDSITTHTSTSDGTGPDAWDSGGILVGGVFTHTFLTPGTFGYHCAIHPNMTGTVVVVGPPLDKKAYLPAVIR